jgi:hypothetical protein
VGAMHHVYTQVPVFLAFQGEGSSRVVGGSMSSKFLCVLGSRTYHQAP